MSERNAAGARATGHDSAPEVALVVAVADNGVIGRAGRLPWHLPDDLRRFRDLTVGHAVIMGRRTFESIGRALPGRRNLVLTRRGLPACPGVEPYPSLAAALAACEGAQRVFVIGGQEVFAEALAYARTVYLTRVHARVAGDTRFPELNPTRWRRREVEHHPADAEHEVAFTFEVWQRAQPERRPRSDRAAAGSGAG